MKKTVKYLSICLALVMALSVLLTSCGSGSSKSYATEEAYPAEEELAAAADTGFYDEEADADYMEDYSGETASESDSGTDTSAAQGQEKWIYTGSLEVWTSEFETGTDCIENTVSEYGGYFEAQNVQCYDEYRYADYTVRIPSDRFEAFLSAMSDSDCVKVVSQNSERENISETYYDIVNRLNTLQIKLDRLNELLAQAEDMEDMITIESAITDVEYQIESYTGELNHYDSQVDYSTVYISLSEVSDVEEELEPTLGQRISAGFSEGIDRLCMNSANFLVWFISHIFGILIFAIVVAVVVIVIRYARRNTKHRTKKKQNLLTETESSEVPDDKDDKTE